MRMPTIVHWVRIAPGGRRPDVIDGDTGPKEDGVYLNQDDVLAVLDAAEPDEMTNRTALEAARARLAAIG
jgi:hypothetical protein